MRSLRVVISLALVALLTSAGLAIADYSIKDGNSALQTVFSFVCSATKICPAHVIIDSTGAEKATAGNPLRTDPVGTTAQPVKLQDGAGNAITSATRGSQQPLSVQIVDGSGAQVTSFGGSGGTASNFGSAFPTPGTAAGFSDGTNMVAGRVVASGADAVSNATPWMVSGAFNYVYNGTTWDRLRGDTTNGVWANVKTSVLPTGAATSANQPTNAAIASTTSGQTGYLGMGAVTTAAPTYTTAQTNPLSLTTAGALRVDGSGVTQPVSGTVAATQSGTWTVQPGNTANTTPWLFQGNVSNASSAVATSSTEVPTNAYNYGFNGTTWDQLQVDASKFLKVNCAAGCTGATDTTASLSGMTVNNAATQIALVGTNSVSVLLSGTWTATLTPEVSTDGGTTWVATSFYNVNTHLVAATVSANGTYDIMGTGGKSHARVRISAFTSGTVTGSLRAVAQAPSANDAQAQELTNTTDGTDTAYAGSGTATVKGYFKGLYNAMTGAIPAGTNVIGKVSIDQTTPGTTNLVALAANQSVNTAQVNGVTTLTGTGASGTGSQRVSVANDSQIKIWDGTNNATVKAASTAPVTATDTAVVVGLRPDSPGIVTLGQTTKSASVPVAIASDQVGTAGTANATVTTVQGISGMTPIIANPTNGFPSGATPITASATGTTLATTATLAGTTGKTTYICGFSIRANATAAATGNATVTGTITGTMNFTQWTAPLASGIGVVEHNFSTCIPASATNTGIAAVSAAPGSGGTVSVSAWGFQL